MFVSNDESESDSGVGEWVWTKLLDESSAFMDQGTDGRHPIFVVGLVSRGERFTVTQTLALPRPGTSKEVGRQSTGSPLRPRSIKLQIRVLAPNFSIQSFPTGSGTRKDQNGHTLYPEFRFYLSTDGAGRGLSSLSPYSFLTFSV